MVNYVTSNVTQLRPVGETDLSRGGRAQAGAAVAPAPAPGNADNLSLSVTAGMLPEAMKKGPPVDQALVAHLSAEIAAGRYPLNPGRIAEALSLQASILAD